MCRLQDRIVSLEEGVELDVVTHTDPQSFSPSVANLASQSSKSDQKTRGTFTGENAFREISIYPTNEDIHVNTIPAIRAIKRRGRYESVSHYLDVHFRLLREDYVRPLREGIGEFLENEKAGNLDTNLKGMRVYRGVQIVSLMNTSDGIAHRVHFDNNLLKTIRWEASKRLIYGSLLCLSRDNFQTLEFATVAGREIEDLKEGYLDIRFVDSLTSQCELGGYVMVETNAYFESYRPVMLGLQEMTSDMPFKDYIVFCKTYIRPPSYLQQLQEDGRYDLTSLLRPHSSTELKHSVKDVSVFASSEWPESATLCLDDSQLTAVQTALTKEFAIIQGPPGTGKTYVGLKIVECLLANKAVWGQDRQILVVCYTNHALDQFLEGILDIAERKLCRIGGRSKSLKLEEYTMKNIKKAMRCERRKDVYDAHQSCRGELGVLGFELKKVSAQLQVSSTGILHETRLKDYMQENQWDSLSFASSQPFDTTSSLVHYWQNAVDINEVCEEPAFRVERRQSIMPLWLDIDEDMFGEFEGFGQSSIYALTPDHIEAFIIRQETRKRQGDHFFDESQCDINLQSEKNELQHRLNIYLRDQTSRQHIRLDRFTSPWDIPYVCRWDIYHNLHGRLVANLENNLGQIRKERYALENRLTETTDAQKKKVLKNLQTKRHAEMSILDTFYILSERLGILRTTVLLDILTSIEKESFSFNTGTADDYFFAKWLGYTDTVEYLLEESKNCMEYDSSYSDFSEDDLEVEDGGVGDKIEIPENQLIDKEDERQLLAQAKQMTPWFTREVRVHELAIHFVERVPALPQTTRVKRDQQLRVEHIVGTQDKMSTEEANSIHDVWKLKLSDRCRLYAYWLSLYQEEKRKNIASCKDRYDTAARRMKRIREDEDYHIMERRTVVGMTTTGAAKYRQILERLKPPIVVVEEASEVLESHLITALTPSCEHLILIGDHKQLRPCPAVYALARHYNLELSLFERMVINDIRCDTLELQHRMRPEIAELMQFIYPELKTHDSVRNLEPVKGVSCNMYFVDHQFPEERHNENNSVSNKHEAGFLVALCRHLLLQGYEPFQITVLATYSGQVFELKKAMHGRICQEVRVTTVDNYQGEENDIILLSLVRSNTCGSVGFLRVENRVCVALSRARKGLFVIGNFTLLSSQSSLWLKVVTLLKSRDRCGEELLLYCQNHPKRGQTRVRTETDFALAPEGGCERPCESRLECGHQCGKRCHVLDLDHKNTLCKKRCTKKCDSGHKCKKLCYEVCGKCTVMVTQVLPKCNHEQSVPCHQDLNTVICQMECSYSLPCGHSCDRKCGENHTVKCQVEVQRRWPCGHLFTTACHNDPSYFPCPEPCAAILECGHPCTGSCSECLQGRLHAACKHRCRRTLVCGHECEPNCTKICPPCKRLCKNRCVHSRCEKRCGDACTMCQEGCEWKCEHQECTKLCGEICDRPPCNEPCKKRLRCDHPCIGLCGEECPDLCRICCPDKVREVFFGTEDEEDARFISLRDCSHTFEVTAMDKWMEYNAEDPAGMRINVHLKKCPKCNTSIRRSLRYGNSIKQMLKDIDQVKSKIRGENKLTTSERNQLVIRINELDSNSKEQVFKNFTSDKYLSQQKLCVLENQIALLAYADELRKRIVSNKQEIEGLNTMEEAVEKVQERVASWREYVSEQELREARYELYRVSFLLKAQKANKLNEASVPTEDRKELQTLTEKLMGAQPFNAELRREIEEVLKRLAPLGISDIEKEMIVRAMGLQQGHWFKCQNGHVYAIGECGGAMQEASCPECQCKIGGTQHKLLEGNTLAPEMDGAKHPAWSDQANMANYALEDF